MGVVKPSSRTACFLLWLFVAHSVQVCVLAVPAARSEGAPSDGFEKNINVLDTPNAHNAVTHNAVTHNAEPSGVVHALESKGQPAESGGIGESSKSGLPQLASTAASKTKEESNVPSPASIGTQAVSSQGQQDQFESVGGKRDGGKVGQNTEKPSDLPTKQQDPIPANGPAGEQQGGGGGQGGHPAPSSSDKSTANIAVDAGKQNSGGDNMMKHPGTEKTSVKKSSEGSKPTASVIPAVSTSEATTLAQEKMTTTLKPAEPAHPVSSEHAKLLPGVLSQGQEVPKKYSDALPDMTKDLGGMPPASSGQEVPKKYSDALPDVTKDLGGMPPASSGNIEYGHLKEPDSGEDLEPALPAQKNPTFGVSGSAQQLGAQPVVGSIGGSRPEKPLDASAAAGSMPLLPAQDDSHFFAYFLTAVVLCVVGYLAFHNKRKILALILEGRHERQRRHNGHYRRLDNVDDASAVRKGRGSF